MAEYQAIQSFVNQVIRRKKSPRVLEAGCGSMSHIKLNGKSRVIGIDISKKQLDKNPLLDEEIVGNIETYKLPKEAYDVIVCWNVMEHLARPTKALHNFVRAVKKDGLIILALPNILSVKGLVTKLTPHRFHVWTYRRLFGKKDAGKRGEVPFKTYLRFQIRPSRLKKFAKKNDLTIKYFKTYEQWRQLNFRQRYWLANVLFGMIGFFSKTLTLGKINLNHSDLLLVLKKA